jgi:Domain of unknown function (DUF4157)
MPVRVQSLQVHLSGGSAAASGAPAMRSALPALLAPLAASLEVARQGPPPASATARALRSSDPTPAGAPPMSSVVRRLERAAQTHEQILSSRVMELTPAGLRAAGPVPAVPMLSGGGGAGGDDPAVRLQIQASVGVPLDATSRREMEAHFGHDLSRVRVHTDQAAASAAQLLGARAFTLGEHIYFNRGSFSPTTDSGRGLLGHELAHVVQGYQGQLSEIAASALAAEPTGVADRIEAFAEAHEQRVASGEVRSPVHIDEVSLGASHTPHQQAPLEEIAGLAKAKAQAILAERLPPAINVDLDTVSVRATVRLGNLEAASDALAQEIVRAVVTTLGSDATA